MEQGNVLRLHKLPVKRFPNGVSIPLEQGNVLRPLPFGIALELNDKSQSLWNRAMSYDRAKRALYILSDTSQSLWNRAMSYDFGIALELSDKQRVSIPLEQGNVLRLEALKKSLEKR